MSKSKEEMLQIVNDNIAEIENKDFNMYFFVLDTCGNPSSALEYIYRTALILQKKGYNVTMLHQEKEFIGVGEWMGEEYGNLPHKNIEEKNVEIGPSDFLFIPEIFANVIAQTKNLPCKRVVLVQNYNQITEFMPVSHTLENMQINDVIATTKVQGEKIKKYFPNVSVHYVCPSISKVFTKDENPKKLIVNLISKDQSLIHQIVKPFYWENPIFKWVGFRDLRNLSQEEFANALKESPITVWVDEGTNFGYSALEALRCGNIVLGKIPQHPSDWMIEKKGDSEELTDSIIWFNDIDMVPEMLNSLIWTWINNKIPKDIYESASKLDSLYTEEIQANEIEEVYVKGIIKKRLNDFVEVKANLDKGLK